MKPTVLVYCLEITQVHRQGPSRTLSSRLLTEEKNYVIKSRTGKVVATCTRLKGFSGGNVDNYQVIVAKDVDVTRERMGWILLYIIMFVCFSLKEHTPSNA